MTDIQIDGRRMVPPEPMERVLSELDNLGDGDRIRLLVPHDPQPLYRILKMNGYTHSSSLQDDGTVEVLIWKSPAKPG
jgi:uncharacterized protein (DUF2249 family)